MYYLTPAALSLNSLFPQRVLIDESTHYCSSSYRKRITISMGKLTRDLWQTVVIMIELPYTEESFYSLWSKTRYRAVLPCKVVNRVNLHVARQSPMSDRCSTHAHTRTHGTEIKGQLQQLSSDPRWTEFD